MADKPSTGTKQVKKRDPKTGRFLTGNKTGGRKEYSADIKQMLSAATPDACKLLCSTINDEDAKLDLRIRCCEIVFDRVYGRPLQAIDASIKDIPQVVFVGGDNIAD